MASVSNEAMLVKSVSSIPKFSINYFKYCLIQLNMFFVIKTS